MSVERPVRHIFFGKWPRRVISAITLSSFLLSNLSFGFDELPSNAPGIDLDDLSLPRNIATIQELWISPVPGAPLVFNIQDAHCNYFAQQSIIAIIDNLVRAKGVKVINLEGGSGGYDLTGFTDIRDADIRRAVSGHFVKEGMVSGAEYYAINNPDLVSLWGVEDPGLYLKNLAFYRDSLRDKAAVDERLSGMDKAIDKAKADIFSKDLLAHDIKFIQYKTGSIDFKTYIRYIAGALAGRDIDSAGFTHIASIRETLDIEQNIDFRKANSERDRLVEKLNGILSKKEIENLAMKTAEFRARKIRDGDYYESLVKTARSAGIGLKDFTEMDKYLGYVSLYETVDKKALMKELDAAETAVRASLAASEAERELCRISKHFLLLKQMLNTTLTLEDHRYYQEHKNECDWSAFTTYINKTLPGPKTASGTTTRTPDGGDRLVDNTRRLMEGFYETSFSRDEAFIKNMKRDTGPAVIVAGGFHTKNLQTLFRANGISYVSIMPSFVSENGYESPYFRLLSGNPDPIGEKIRSVLSTSTLAIASFLNVALAGLMPDAEIRKLTFDLHREYQIARETAARKIKASGHPSKKGFVIRRGTSAAGFDWQGHDLPDIAIREATTDEYTIRTIEPATPKALKETSPVPVISDFFNEFKFVKTVVQNTNLETFIIKVQYTGESKTLPNGSRLIRNASYIVKAADIPSGNNTNNDYVDPLPELFRTINPLNDNPFLPQMIGTYGGEGKHEISMTDSKQTPDNQVTLSFLGNLVIFEDVEGSTVLDYYKTHIRDNESSLRAADLLMDLMTKILDGYEATFGNKLVHGDLDMSGIRIISDENGSVTRVIFVDHDSTSPLNGITEADAIRKKLFKWQYLSPGRNNRRLSDIISDRCLPQDDLYALCLIFDGFLFSIAKPTPRGHYMPKLKGTGPTGVDYRKAWTEERLREIIDNAQEENIIRRIAQVLLKYQLISLERYDCEGLKEEIRAAKAREEQPIPSGAPLTTGFARYFAGITLTAANYVLGWLGYNGEGPGSRERNVRRLAAVIEEPVILLGMVTVIPLIMFMRSHNVSPERRWQIRFGMKRVVLGGLFTAAIFTGTILWLGGMGFILSNPLLFTGNFFGMMAFGNIAGHWYYNERYSIGKGWPALTVPGKARKEGYVPPALKIKDELTKLGERAPSIGKAIAKRLASWQIIDPDLPAKDPRYADNKKIFAALIEVLTRNPKWLGQGTINRTKQEKNHQLSGIWALLNIMIEGEVTAGRVAEMSAAYVYGPHCVIFDQDALRDENNILIQSAWDDENVGKPAIYLIPDMDKAFFMAGIKLAVEKGDMPRDKAVIALSKLMTITELIDHEKDIDSIRATSRANNPNITAASVRGVVIDPVTLEEKPAGTPTQALAATTERILSNENASGILVQSGRTPSGTPTLPQDQLVRETLEERGWSFNKVALDNTKRTSIGTVNNGEIEVFAGNKDASLPGEMALLFCHTDPEKRKKPEGYIGSIRLTQGSVPGSREKGWYISNVQLTSFNKFQNLVYPCLDFAFAFLASQGVAIEGALNVRNPYMAHSLKTYYGFQEPKLGGRTVSGTFGKKMTAETHRLDVDYRLPRENYRTLTRFIGTRSSRGVLGQATAKAIAPNGSVLIRSGDTLRVDPGLAALTLAEPAAEENFRKYLSDLLAESLSGSRKNLFEGKETVVYLPRNEALEAVTDETRTGSENQFIRARKGIDKSIRVYALGKDFTVKFYDDTEEGRAQVNKEIDDYAGTWGVTPEAAKRRIVTFAFREKGQPDIKAPWEEKAFTLYLNGSKDEKTATPLPIARCFTAALSSLNVFDLSRPDREDGEADPALIGQATRAATRDITAISGLSGEALEATAEDLYNEAIAKGPLGLLALSGKLSVTLQPVNINEISAFHEAETEILSSV